MKRQAKETHQISHIHTLLKGFQSQNNIPMHQFMVKYFNNYRFLGSRDRKAIRQGVYSYLRLGNILKNRNFEERLSIALFLCLNEEYELLSFLKENNKWLNNINVAIPFSEKLKFLQSSFPEFDLFDICPWIQFISEKIDRHSWVLSMFHSPGVWLRLRKGFESLVKEELAKSSIAYETNPAFHQALYLPPQTPLQNLESFRKGWFEIQDLSSQRIFENITIPEGSRVWDCCCGSGGKSLLLLDNFPGIELFCSDNRESILVNLKERLFRVGYMNIRTENIDLTKPFFQNKLFDIILADAPCSGSGTWTRTPETMHTFNEKDFEKFNSLQYSILKNLSSHLKPHGKLIYSTCSVFSAENELLIHKLEAENIYKNVSEDYLSGIDIGSDTLYRAVMVK